MSGGSDPWLTCTLGILHPMPFVGAEISPPASVHSTRSRFPVLAVGIQLPALNNSSSQAGWVFVYPAKLRLEQEPRIPLVPLVHVGSSGPCWGWISLMLPPSHSQVPQLSPAQLCPALLAASLAASTAGEGWGRGERRLPMTQVTRRQLSSPALCLPPTSTF